MNNIKDDELTELQTAWDKYYTLPLVQSLINGLVIYDDDESSKVVKAEVAKLKKKGSIEYNNFLTAIKMIENVKMFTGSNDNQNIARVIKNAWASVKSIIVSHPNEWAFNLPNFSGAQTSINDAHKLIMGIKDIYITVVGTLYDVLPAKPDTLPVNTYTMIKNPVTKCWIRQQTGGTITKPLNREVVTKKRNHSTKKHINRKKRGTRVKSMLR